MIPADLLKPARATGESFAAYRERRSHAHRVVKGATVGRAVYPNPPMHRVSAAFYPEIDRLILKGDLRVIGLATAPDGKPLRVVRQKGKPYIRPLRHPYESHADYRARRYAL